MFALVLDGVVAEVAAAKFEVHSDLSWHDLTGITPTPEPGWTFDGTTFAAPPVVVVPEAAAPTLASLQAQLATLTAQIAALAK